MTAILFGLGAGISWGISDFLGGRESRSLPVLVVGMWSQAAGAVLLSLAVVVLGPPYSYGSVFWGLAAGFTNVLGIVLFYRALADGVVALVAPVAACGALVPIAVSVSRGEPLNGFAQTGMCSAFVGLFIIVSSAPLEGEARKRLRPALKLAVAAALSLGLGQVLLHGGATSAGGSPLVVVAASRVSALLLLLVGMLVTQHESWSPGGRMAPIAAVGLLDAAANVLFAEGAAMGKLGIVAALGSLYPVTTTLLGRFVLSERLTRRQSAGVVLALFGAALMSAG